MAQDPPEFPKEINNQPKLNDKSPFTDEELCVDISKKNEELKKLYDKLWDTADELRANSKLRPNQYSTPVLGIIFLRYADHRFEQTKKELEEKIKGSRALDKRRFQRSGTLYLSEKSRFQFLLNLPEGDDIGGAIDDAMRAIERENPELLDVLPKNYSSMEDRILIALLKNFSIIPTSLDRDIFGKIYEYFLGKFAMSEAFFIGPGVNQTHIEQCKERVIKNNENIFGILSGTIENPFGVGGTEISQTRHTAKSTRNGILVCTDQRLIFYMSKMFGRWEMEYAPIDQISSVAFNKGLFQGRIHVTVINDEKVIKWVDNTAAQIIVGLIEKELDKIRAGKKTGGANNVDPMKALQMRLVNGEITVEQYEKLKNILGG